MNGCKGTREERSEQLVEVVMQGRPGLDAQKVTEMVNALWSCEG